MLGSAMVAASASLLPALLGSRVVHAQAQPGVSDTEIMLGQSVALTGPAAELGIEMRNGAAAYFTELNAAGGVNGRKITLTTLDDGYEPDRAVANTKKLIDELKVFALFGYVGTPTANAANPIFTAAKVPFFGAFTGAESLRNPVNRYIFNVRASYFDETEKIVEHLTSLGMKNVAVFYQNDAYGKTGLDGVERALARRNLKMTASATVERNSVAVTEAVKFLAPKEPDVIVMISAYTSIAAFVREAKKARYHGQFYNVSFVGSVALSKALGNEGHGVGISQVVPFPYSASIPLVRDYQAAMKKHQRGELSFSSIEGYLAARVLADGLKKAGKTLTREGLVDALETMNNVDIGGFNVNFSKTSHSGSKFVELTIIGREGKFLR